MRTLIYYYNLLVHVLSLLLVHVLSFINQHCFSEIECLAEHGITLPPNMQGLTDEQVVELKLKDEWADRCTPQGGVRENPDKVGVRNGQGKPDRDFRILTGTVPIIFEQK